jgi:hypothetical protein
MLYLVCTCVPTDRKKYSRIRGIYICYNNEHNHHERKLPEIQKKRVPFALCALYMCHRVIVWTLADIFYEPTIAILNEFQSVARRA